MMNFVRQNWIFIVLPAVVVVAVVIWLLSTGSSSDNGFNYPLY